MPGVKAWAGLSSSMMPDWQDWLLPSVMEKFKRHRMENFSQTNTFPTVNVIFQSGKSIYSKIKCWKQKFFEVFRISIGHIHFSHLQCGPVLPQFILCYVSSVKVVLKPKYVLPLCITCIMVKYHPLVVPHAPPNTYPSPVSSQLCASLSLFCHRLRDSSGRHWLLLLSIKCCE